MRRWRFSARKWNGECSFFYFGSFVVFHADWKLCADEKVCRFQTRILSSKLILYDFIDGSSDDLLSIYVITLLIFEIHFGQKHGLKTGIFQGKSLSLRLVLLTCVLYLDNFLEDFRYNFFLGLRNVQKNLWIKFELKVCTKHLANRLLRA